MINKFYKNIFHETSSYNVYAVDTSTHIKNSYFTLPDNIINFIEPSNEIQLYKNIQRVLLGLKTVKSQ
jgi:hypothetical protein